MAGSGPATTIFTDPWSSDGSSLSGWRKRTGPPISRQTVQTGEPPDSQSITVSDAKLCLRSCALRRSRSELQIDGVRLDRARNETSWPVRILAVAPSSGRLACGKGVGHDNSVRKGRRTAASLGDIRIVNSVGANVLWYGGIHNSAADNQTIAQFLMASGLSWTTRGGIDANTANGDFGAYVGLGRGIEGAGIAAVWEQAQMIRDPYTSATKGEVQLTLSYLWQLGFPRTANF